MIRGKVSPFKVANDRVRVTIANITFDRENGLTNGANKGPGGGTVGTCLVMEQAR